MSSEIRDLTGGHGVERAIDCSAHAEARATAICATRQWGRIVMIGEGGTVTFNPSPDIIHDQKTIYGSWVSSIWRMEELVEKTRPLEPSSGRDRDASVRAGPGRPKPTPSWQRANAARWPSVPAASSVSDYRPRSQVCSSIRGDPSRATPLTSAPAQSPRLPVGRSPCPSSRLLPAAFSLNA